MTLKTHPKPTKNAKINCQGSLLVYHNKFRYNFEITTLVLYDDSRIFGPWIIKYSKNFR